jgi:hypothetical protein
MSISKVKPVNSDDGFYTQGAMTVQELISQEPAITISNANIGTLVVNSLSTTYGESTSIAMGSGSSTSQTPILIVIQSSFNGSSLIKILNSSAATLFLVDSSGNITTPAGLGVWGHAAPGSQPVAPTDTASIIALLQSYGLSA